MQLTHVKMTSKQQNEVISVICRNIKPGHEKDYDDWLRRYLTFERKAPGYLGTTIILPGDTGSNLRYIIHRFTNRELTEAWENSAEYKNLLEEANNYSTRHYETSTGLETWFTLPNLKTRSQPPPPPRWKMAIVAFIGAYCISSLAQYILSFFLEQRPLLFNLFMNIILIIGLTYLAMPLLSRLLRHWLYQSL
jgi:antibiotic biosynthesis monooxygenase (ABM) superfamily enzyme